MSAQEGTGLLTDAEVAAAFHVCSRTVRRWVKARKLTPVPTAEGRRFRESQVQALLRGDGEGIPG